MVVCAAAVAVVPAGAAEAPGAARSRLSIAREASAPASTFTARLETSLDEGRTWAGAAGEVLTFAFVGEGAVTAISDPAGGMACTTSSAGTCTITVESPGDSSLTVVFAGQTATATV
jgi:hypothetical protein